MRNRKPAMASKHARSAKKIERKVQRTAQAVVKSPTARRAAAASSTKSPPQRHVDSDQEARLFDNPTIALQDHSTQTMTDTNSTDTHSKRELAFPVTTDVQAYQAKLLEIAQANMQFAVEFAQRLAWIRSPLEFFGVIAEFTSKRMDMFRKYSTEMAELSTRR